MTLLSELSKFPLAADRADNWIRSLRPNERESAETMLLKLAYNAARVEQANKLTKQSPNDRNANRLIKDARSDLRSMLRVSGPHLAETRELLAQLGIEQQTADVGTLPTVTTFDEAVEAANERLTRSETDALGLALIIEELESSKTSADRKKELSTQKKEVTESIERDQRQAIELFSQALRLFTPDDSREQLFDARFKMGFLHFKQQQIWEGISVGQFLARKNPGSDQGLRAAALALGGYSELFQSAEKKRQASLSETLEPFALYLIKTWPKSKEAAAAGGVLVQLAIIRKDYDRAGELVETVSAGGTSPAQRELGLSLYGKYIQLKQDSSADAKEVTKLRDESSRHLAAFRSQSKSDSNSSKAIQAANALCQMQLDAGKASAAANTLLKGSSAPISLLKKDSAAAQSRTAMSSYRLAILTTAAQMLDGKVKASEAAKQMQSYIGELQNIAQDSANGSKELMGVFVGLAKDLQKQLGDAKKPESRQNLSSVLTVVASEAAKSDAFNTRYWAADTVLSIAEELSRTSSGRQAAGASYAAAEKILREILNKESGSPGWIDPPSLSKQIQLLLARSQRGMGDHVGSIKVLAGLLKESPMLLDAQIEAARTLESWGKLKPEYFKTAYAGGPKSSKLFWGWGKIAQETYGKEDFSEQFFNARYHLALCRYRNAKATNDTAEMARAEKDVTRTSSLFPELGGPETKKKFAALLSLIRKG